MNISHGTQNGLTTYYTIKNNPNILKDYSEKYPFKSYFLDSGAYGVFVRNETLDVKKYGKYVKDNIKYIDIYANLDDRNSEEITISNLKYLESIGLKPLPVWGLSSGNFRLLKELLDKYDYIAIGSMVNNGNSKEDLHNNLKKIFQIAFSYGKNPDGSMKKKFHGFGITNLTSLTLYPFYSVDSTSWTNGARFGIMQVFDGKNLVNIQAKDHKKMLKYWNCIPVDLRDMDLLMDKSGVSNYLNRQKVCADAFKQLEVYVTKLWRIRGLWYN